jgi:hypothetical protein
MPQFGGKDSKRHFTVVMGGKEHGLYVSSTPSSAAKKAVTKLCTANKSKKVDFHIREITQGSKKKTYGPYSGHIEKLKEPIKLKGRVIKYKPVAKLSKKNSEMKGGFSSTESLDSLDEKIFKNFLVLDKAPYHFKQRTFKSDSLYFGNNNLIDYSGKKYYKFSLININDKEGIIPLALRIIVTNEEANIFKNKLKILPIPGVDDYKFFVIYTVNLLNDLKKMYITIDDPSCAYFEYKYYKKNKYLSFTDFEKTLVNLVIEMSENLELIDKNPTIFNWESYSKSKPNGFYAFKNFKDTILRLKPIINRCFGSISKIEQNIQKNKNYTNRTNQELNKFEEIIDRIKDIDGSEVWNFYIPIKKYIQRNRFNKKSEIVERIKDLQIRMKNDIFRLIKDKPEPYDYKKLNDDLVACCLPNWKESSVYILNSIIKKENSKQEEPIIQHDDYRAYHNGIYRY